MRSSMEFKYSTSIGEPVLPPTGPKLGSDTGYAKSIARVTLFLLTAIHMDGKSPLPGQGSSEQLRHVMLQSKEKHLASCGP